MAYTTNAQGYQVDERGNFAPGVVTPGMRDSAAQGIGRVAYDPQKDLNYNTVNGHRVYLSPVSNVGTRTVFLRSLHGAPITDTGGGMLHGRPQWNPKTGEWDVNLDMGKVLSWAAAAGIGAGAIMAAMPAAAAVTAPAAATAAPTAATPTIGSLIPAGVQWGATAAPAAGGLAPTAAASTGLGATSLGATAPGWVGPTAPAGWTAGGGAGTGLGSALRGVGGYAGPLISAGTQLYGARIQAGAQNRATDMQAQNNAALIAYQREQDAEAKREFDAQQAMAKTQWDAQQAQLAQIDARKDPYRQASRLALLHLGDLLGAKFA